MKSKPKQGISVKLPPHLYAFIRKLANDNGRTIVGQLRMMIMPKQ